MIRLGKCYKNLMVDLNPTNMKLAARASRIVVQATGCTPEQAQEVLERTDNDVKLAILVLVTGMQIEEAKSALRRAGGFLRKAITHSAPC
jgi:N-acetylmuramic acid 6-phosphate etherase